MYLTPPKYSYWFFPNYDETVELSSFYNYINEARVQIQNTKLNESQQPLSSLKNLTTIGKALHQF